MKPSSENCCAIQNASHDYRIFSKNPSMILIIVPKQAYKMFNCGQFFLHPMSLHLKISQQ
jgi:hypothetical protein